MSKTPLSLLVSLVLLLVASPASAQLLGSKGDAVFGAERLFGVRGERFTAELPAPAEEIEVNDTVISFGLAEELTPYNIPRLTFDYLVIDHLSIGGALGFSMSNISVNGDDEPGEDATLFLINPRVGWLHMFGKVAGIWPRGGFTYHSSSVDDVATQSSLALNVECMFPIVFTDHFGLLLGIAFDQSIVGNQDPENGPEYDVSFRSIGLQVGLLGWI